MRLHIGPGLHAFAHGLPRQSDEGAWTLNRRVRRLFEKHDLLGDGRDGRGRLIVTVTLGVRGIGEFVDRSEKRQLRTAPRTAP